MGWKRHSTITHTGATRFSLNGRTNTFAVLLYPINTVIKFPHFKFQQSHINICSGSLWYKRSQEIYGLQWEERKSLVLTLPSTSLEQSPPSTLKHFFVAIRWLYTFTALVSRDCKIRISQCMKSIESSMSLSKTFIFVICMGYLEGHLKISVYNLGQKLHLAFQLSNYFLFTTHTLDMDHEFRTCFIEWFNNMVSDTK